MQITHEIIDLKIKDIEKEIALIIQCENNYKTEKGLSDMPSLIRWFDRVYPEIALLHSIFSKKKNFGTRTTIGVLIGYVLAKELMEMENDNSN